MKKYLRYILLMTVVLFLSINRVNAAMRCGYKNNVNLYCTGNSASSCSATIINQKSDRAIFTKVAVGTVTFDKGNSKCPSKVKKSGGKYNFGTSGKAVSIQVYDADADWSSWSSSFSNLPSVDAIGANSNVEVSRNNYGFVDYSIKLVTGADKSEDKEIVIYGYGQSTSSLVTCNETIKNKGKFEFNGKKCDDIKPSNESSTPATTPTTTSPTKTSPTATTSATTTTTPPSGTTASSKGFCLYKNINEDCIDDKGDANGDCSAASHATSYLIRSSYMIVSFDSNNKPLSVYLPVREEKSWQGETAGAWQTKYKKSTIESEVNKIIGDDYTTIQNISDKYFEKMPGNVLTDLYNDRGYSTTGGCPTWFCGNNGCDGQNYDDEQIFYEYYTENPEDNPDSEDPGTSGQPFEDTVGSYVCKYNDGDFIMKVNIKKTRTSVSVFFPNNTSLKGAFYNYERGKGTSDAIAWFSAAGKYGNVESGNDGSFEKYLTDSNPPSGPAEVVFNSKGGLSVCYSESDCKGKDGYEGKNPVCTKADDADGDDLIDIKDCKDLLSPELRKTLNTIFTIFRIIVPLLLIGLGIVDFAKATFAQKDDDMKKSQSTFFKRVLIAVIIFFIPTFINLLLNIANNVWGWNASTCEVGESNVSNITE